MGVEPLPRYFGPATWPQTVVMGGVFTAIPPYPSSGLGWAVRICLSLVVGLGSALTETWAARRTERRARAADSAALARAVAPKERPPSALHQ